MLFHSLPVSLAFLRKNWDRCKIFILQRPLCHLGRGVQNSRGKLRAYSSAMTSHSSSTSLGSLATSTQERAGKGSVKYWA